MTWPQRLKKVLGTCQALNLKTSQSQAIGSSALTNAKPSHLLCKGLMKPIIVSSGWQNSDLVHVCCWQAQLAATTQATRIFHLIDSEDGEEISGSQHGAKQRAQIGIPCMNLRREVRLFVRIKVRAVR
jgi:hypothetical protein